MKTNKLYLKNLSVEITRRCNMTCGHCLRGDSEQTDIRQKDIYNVLKNVKYIQHFNITGGEPSLNPAAMRYILELLKRFGIGVYSFYIVTNGSRSALSQEFIDVCAALYDYQEEKTEDNNCHMLEMSDDRFHDPAAQEQVSAKLGKYPFFGLRGQSENIFLLKEGRCEAGNTNNIYPIYLTATDYVYGDVYLNAEGMILSNGDLSYNRQRENVLCSSGGFMEYLKTVLRKDE